MKLQLAKIARTLCVLVATCCFRPAIAQTALDQAVIAGLERNVPASLVSQRSALVPLQADMSARKIPGVSVAVFRDGQLAWSKAWGVSSIGSSAPASPATLFQAASISKPVAAIGAMTLARDGLLTLDGDVSKAVNGWQVGSPITIRQLLSHTSGLGVSGFQGYKSGVPLPSTLQILTGQTPANSPSVGLEGQPGTTFSYSGGGYTVLQAFLEQVATTQFPDLMRQRVLAPLGMTESVFAQPLPASLLPIAARGHQNGIAIEGGSNTYPELAAAGLWTTPRDLGKIAIEVQKALRGQGVGVVTPQTAREMLTPQVGGYGLGFGLVSLDNVPFFFHRGLNEGFETSLIASAAPTGPSYVIVVMTNGQGGSNLANGIVRAIGRDYGWSALAPRRVTQRSQSQSQLAALEGFYQVSDQKIALEMFENRLYLRDGNWQRAPLMAINGAANEQRFAVENRNFDIAFPKRQSRNAPLVMAYVEGTKSTQLERSGRPFSALINQPPLLRGSMNNWGADAVFVKTGPSVWTLTAPLPAGNHEFKIATQDWTSLNLGAPLETATVSVTRPIRLAPMGDNLKLNLATATTAVFKIDTSDERRATLSISIK